MPGGRPALPIGRALVEYDILEFGGACVKNTSSSESSSSFVVFRTESAPNGAAELTLPIPAPLNPPFCRLNAAFAPADDCNWGGAPFLPASTPPFPAPVFFPAKTAELLAPDLCSSHAAPAFACAAAAVPASAPAAASTAASPVVDAVCGAVPPTAFGRFFMAFTIALPGELSLSELSSSSSSSPPSSVAFLRAALFSPPVTTISSSSSSSSEPSSSSSTTSSQLFTSISSINLPFT
mmetsp:Transcript_17259/g.42829  ORF Transcript_17259/g.42829 Transcript_17259/m.42829 type:complete len:237 (-) Transcript_17259:441-1151(-)